MQQNTKNDVTVITGENMKNKFFKIILCIFAIVSLIMLVIYSKDTSETIKYCLEVCTKTLIPSMFAYMVLCTFLIKSKLSVVITTPLWYLLRGIIKLDISTFSIFVLSLIAGYPVGIKMLKELISQNKNYSEIAKYISPVCYASGPAFITGIVGNVIYNNAIAGYIVFFSCTLSNILGAVFLTRKEKTKKVAHKEEIIINGNAITDVILSSAKAMLMVCLSMILFNIVIMFIEAILIGHISINGQLIYIKAFIEVTGICCFDASVPLWLTTFFISFGGLCVIFQLYLISDGDLKLSRFVLIRILLSLLSSAICFLITKLLGFEPSVPVFLDKEPMILLQNPIVLISVGVMTVFLIVIMSEETKKIKNLKLFSKKTGFIKKNML